MPELPPGYTYDGEPHWVDSEDCMGGKSPYWRQWVKDPNGHAIAGCAANPSAARDVARMKARDQHQIEILPPKQRLWYEIDKAKKNGRFYDRDLVAVVEILAGLISPRTDSGVRVH